MTIDSLVAELNPSQKDAATTTSPHTLVLAGAGCGKTKTIVARAAYLIASGDPANKIQILTFTKRSASEIVERVKQHIGDEAELLKASTFHAWCISLIRQAPAAFGCKDFSIIDREDQLQLFKMLRNESPAKDLPTAKNLLDMYSYARNTDASLTEVIDKLDPDIMYLKPELAKIYTGYEEKKEARKYLDYDDILSVVAEEMAENPDVLGWVARTLEHVLVDEMQDTNPLQWKLLDPLKAYVSLFCVGDDAQSIYGFRGADFRNVHSFHERVPTSVTLKLEQNYRSTQEILDVSNWLLAESPLNYDKHLVASRGKGELPKLLTFGNEFEESSWIATNIQSRHRGGDAWNTHMILVRSAFAGKAMEASMLARKIPYKFVGGAKLLESAHVRDVLSALRVVANPSDEIAWMRFLTLWDGVGEGTASKITAKLMKQDTLSDALIVLSAESKIPALAVATIKEVLLAETDVVEAIRQACLGLEDVLSIAYKKDWESRKKDYRLVAKLAKKHSTIAGFLEEYLLDPVSITSVEKEDLDDVVTIITVHSAKGTECEVCYVLNVSTGAYPSPYSSGTDDEIEEERRVLYVALTRAKNELIITRRSLSTYGVASSYSSGRSTDDLYFLNGIPSELTTDETGSGLSSSMKADIMTQLQAVAKRKGIKLE